MSVTSKKPDKPGYMTTEFWATAGFVGYELLLKKGLSAEKAEEIVEQGQSAISAFLSGDKDAISTIVVGAVVIFYGWMRSRVKRTKIIAEAKQS